MCTVYRDFAQYCITQHIEDPTINEKTPMIVSKKLLPSPELGPLKMLSPFASIRNITPLIKTREEAHSVLMMIAGKKEEGKQVGKGQSNEEIKSSKNSTLSSFKGQKRSYLLESTKGTNIPTSPLISTEGIHAIPRTHPTRKLGDGQKVVVICSCGNECPASTEGVCEKCANRIKSQSTQGYLYEKVDSKTLNRLWCRLGGSQLYRYKSKTSTESDSMYSLTGCFLNQGAPELVQKNVYVFPIIIHLGASKLTLYAVKKDDQDKWVKALKEAIGYSDLTDFYELGKPLGNGKFGVVREAFHKLTRERVAVKIVKKSKLSVEDLASAKREVEIMKVCQHPNIVRILDTFENVEYIYIVLEILDGGDLFEYLEKRDFRISENRTRTLIHSLATALFYVHSYGIVHRDIKLENILMTNSTDSGEPKLMDFGLSKMIGPNEFCNEPFGTIGYAAPEILRGRPYDKRIDIWSLGVVMFIMLTGHTPFDGESDETLAQYECFI